jgi:endoribonuclease LACTB2
MAHHATREKLAGVVSVDVLLDEGDTLDASLAPLDLAIMHTPGHAPGHLCFFSRTHGYAIVGDMIASEGTILIDPNDDGDMDVYLAQLQRLADSRIRRLLPAHGDPVDDASQRLSFYITHRLAREAKVLAATNTEARSLQEIATLAYADSPHAPRVLAQNSTLAHLERLAKLKTVSRDGDMWRRVT